MTKPTIYVLGPMSGYVNFNFEAFNYVADFLRGQGYPVVNPADHGDHETDWRKCVQRSLTAMMSCDKVVALPGYSESKGAKLEVHVAQEMGIPVSELRVFLKKDDVSRNMIGRVLNRAQGTKISDLENRTCDSTAQSSCGRKTTSQEIILDVLEVVNEAPPGNGIVDRAFEDYSFDAPADFAAMVQGYIDPAPDTTL